MDRKRMENGAFLSEDYFKRLLEKVCEIRLSQRRFYQKIADIYSTAMDECAEREDGSIFSDHEVRAALAEMRSGQKFSGTHYEDFHL